MYDCLTNLSGAVVTLINALVKNKKDSQRMWDVHMWDKRPEPREKLHT